MRRIVTSVGVTVGSLLVTALPAAAQYVPPPEIEPTVVEQAPQAPAPLAFTGVEIGLLVLAVAVLVAVGAFALIMARRRSAQAV
jgi:hypothetical protein